MATFNEMAKDFLVQDRIAVAGVSRKIQGSANGIYKTLRDNGYTVFPLNPNADTVEGDTCYHHVSDIPGGVDGVVIVTRPEFSEEVARECVKAGVPRVWMHYNPMFGEGNSSVSDNAVNYLRENNVQVIAGGCPLMYFDFAHKCMRGILGVMGKLPN